jgi:CheY-like chemotaxis protein
MHKPNSQGKGESTCRRILILDDQPVNIHASSGLFKDNYALKIPTNGINALKIVKWAAHPDIIFSDIKMPDMEGMGILRRIRVISTDRPPYEIFITVMEEED